MQEGSQLLAALREDCQQFVNQKVEVRLTDGTVLNGVIVSVSNAFFSVISEDDQDRTERFRLDYIYSISDPETDKPIDDQ